MQDNDDVDKKKTTKNKHPHCIITDVKKIPIRISGQILTFQDFLSKNKIEEIIF